MRITQNLCSSLLRSEIKKIILSNLLLRARSFLLAAALLLFLLSVARTAFAGNAAWNVNPTSGDWNTAANWTPATVPNGPADTATFNVSSQTEVSLSSSVTLDGIVFNPGASNFRIAANAPAGFFISGVGVTNNSGVAQNFVMTVDGARNQGTIFFVGNATAGDATYTNEGAIVRFAFGGHVEFFNFATAENGTFISNGGTVGNADGGNVIFFDSSTAGQANFIANGATVPGAGGGQVEFGHTSSADHATLTATGGPGATSGGAIFFLDDSTAQNARVEVFDNGSLDIGLHNPPGVRIGLIRGNGLIFLGSRTLSVGKNSNMTFAGLIADGGVSGGGNGSLTKVGPGKLKLTNANTYTGATTIREGTLLADNSTGSATGSSDVRVEAGTLAGDGTIAGPVVIGMGAGGKAILSPGKAADRPAVITLLGRLTFNDGGCYRCGLNSNIASSDEIFADGVTINGGARFRVGDAGATELTPGLVLTIINNTAPTAINGIFSNLADGAIFTIGNNSYQANYAGGDGNDLTLTVVP
jgi:autotransporter-associated beta strand protein